MPKEKILALAEMYEEQNRNTVSLWCMGVNQHVRGTWMNNLINDLLHLITGKISRPGNNPFSLTGQPSACGTVREVGTLCNRLPADMFALFSLLGCAREENEANGSSMPIRTQRRAYDGAPPVIPHPSFRIACIQCHNQQGLQVAGLGFAPPSPHNHTPGMSEKSLCRQCHVFVNTDTTYVANNLQGFRRGQSNRPQYAPAQIPHPIFMREDCFACHSGPATRKGILCSHPERKRCQQCHIAINQR